MHSKSKDYSIEEKIEYKLRRMNFSYEELLKITAAILSSQYKDEQLIDSLTEHINSLMRPLHVLNATHESGNHDTGEALLELLAENKNAVAKGLLDAQKYQKTRQARNAALKRLKDDPKQKALIEIEAHYEASKSSFKRYGFSAQFAKLMHREYPIFEDIKTIQKLVTKLNKSNEHIPKR